MNEAVRYKYGQFFNHTILYQSPKSYSYNTNLQKRFDAANLDVSAAAIFPSQKSKKIKSPVIQLPFAVAPNSKITCYAYRLPA